MIMSLVNIAEWFKEGIYAHIERADKRAVTDKATDSGKQNNGQIKA